MSDIRVKMSSLHTLDPQLLLDLPFFLFISEHLLGLFDVSKGGKGLSLDGGACLDSIGLALESVQKERRNDVRLHLVWKFLEMVDDKVLCGALVARVDDFHEFIAERFGYGCCGHGINNYDLLLRKRELVEISKEIYKIFSSE